VLIPRASPGGRITRSTIFEQSYKAVQFWIAHEWSKRYESPKLTVTAARTLDAFRQAAIADGKASGDGAPIRTGLPLVATIIASIQDRSGPHVPWQTQHFGFKMGRTGNGGETLYERVRPVDLGIGVRFTSSSDKEAEAFTHMLLENAPNVVVNIRNKSTGSIVEIAIAIETQYSMAGAQMGTPGEYATVETTFICKSFIGVTQRFNNIKEVQLVASATFPNTNVEELFTVTSAGNKKITIEAADGVYPAEDLTLTEPLFPG
jgi:hypothetical protein